MAFDVWPGQPYDQGSNAFYVFVHGDDPDEVTAAWDGAAPTAPRSGSRSGRRPGHRSPGSSATASV